MEELNMKRIYTFPTHQFGDLQYRVGQVLPFGATQMYGGINFSIFSSEATGCTLVLYHHRQEEPFAEIPFQEDFRIGNVYTMLVYGLNLDELDLSYRDGRLVLRCRGQELALKETAAFVRFPAAFLHPLQEE